MTWLLDGNLLVALAIDSHVHHERARLWSDAMSEPFATCAVTEGTLLRLHMRFAVDKSVAAAWAELDAIHAMASREFWDEGFGYREVKHDALNGPAQRTGAGDRCVAGRTRPSSRRQAGDSGRWVGDTPSRRCGACAGVADSAPSHPEFPFSPPHEPRSAREASSFHQKRKRIVIAVAK
jgi:hypothetical protein